MRSIRLVSWGLLIALVAIAVARTKLFDSELADHADEAAHFVTGIMVYDYIKDYLGDPPMDFASDYYAHYPKIAIGHWPPLFYVMESAAFAVGGTTIQTAMLMSVFCLLGTILLLYERLRYTYDALTALWCAALPLALSDLRRTATLLLPDIAVTLFSLLAVFAFAKYLRTDRLRDSLWFTLWSSFAILTKGNGIALALFAVLAILFTREFRVIRSWRLWIGGTLVGLVTLTHFFLWNMALNTGGDGQLSHGYALRNLHDNLLGFIMILGVAAFAITAVAAGSVLWRSCVKESEIDKAYLARVAAAHVAAVIMFHVICPVKYSPRYLVPAIPTAIILIAYLSDRLRRYGTRWSLIWAATVLIAVVIPQAVGWQAVVTSRRATGYQAAIRSISNDSESTVILVSGIDEVEGALVAARRLHDPELKDYVLRATKVLAKVSWSGKNYQLTVDRDHLQEMLQTLPVHFVILDDFEYASRPVGAHHQLLKEVLTSNPQLFVNVGTFPVHARGRTNSDALKVYEVTAARGKFPSMELKRLLSNVARKAAGGYTPEPDDSP